MALSHYLIIQRKLFIPISSYIIIFFKLSDQEKGKFIVNRYHGISTSFDSSLATRSLSQRLNFFKTPLDKIKINPLEL